MVVATATRIDPTPSSYVAGSAGDGEARLQRGRGEGEAIYTLSPYIRCDKWPAVSAVVLPLAARLVATCTHTTGNGHARLPRPANTHTPQSISEDDCSQYIHAGHAKLIKMHAALLARRSLASPKHVPALQVEVGGRDSPAC